MNNRDEIIATLALLALVACFAFYLVIF